MIVDVRTYRCRAGGVGPQLAMYEKHGLAAQVRHLGQPFAYLVAETGELNTFVHLWAYENAGEREQKRAGMMNDPEWKEYVKMTGDAQYLVHQRTSLMVPTSFAPIKR
jgi:hypothetical protein